MNVLWQTGEATVRQVRSLLVPSRPLAYTTILTILGRMHHKGLAERVKNGRRFYYRPLVSRDEVLDRMLNRMTQAFFEGSRQRLIRYLAPDAALAAPLNEAAPSLPPAAPETPLQSSVALQTADPVMDTSLL